MEWALTALVWGVDDRLESGGLGLGVLSCNKEDELEGTIWHKRGCGAIFGGSGKIFRE